MTSSHEPNIYNFIKELLTGTTYMPMYIANYLFPIESRFGHNPDSKSIKRNRITYDAMWPISLGYAIYKKTGKVKWKLLS